MKKLALCILAAVGVNLIAIADVPSRLSSDADVVTGYWHRNFDKAKAYADANGIPFVAVWSRDNGSCHYCNIFSDWINNSVFTSWQRTSGIVFWYGSESDYEYQSTKVSSQVRWTMGGNTALPGLRLWWKDHADVVVSGRAGPIGGSGPQALIDYIERTFSGYVPYSIALNQSSDNVGFAFSQTNPWGVEKGASALRSGAIGGNSSSGLSATIQSSGTFSFEWRASCESNDTHTADHAVFLIDGVEVALIDGETEWRTVSVRIDSDSSHSVAWVYSKDASDDDDGVHDDCVRVRSIKWAKDPTVTFNANGGHFGGGATTLSRVVVSGSAVGELPVPDGEGRRFLGWLDAHTGVVVDAGTVMSSDVVFYAQWEKCTVAFNYNSLPAGVSCSLVRDGEWQTTMTLSWGAVRTFFIRNTTADSSVCGLEVEGVYTYKEDGETWEDSIWPSEYVEAPNALGGYDHYVVLTREDWDWSMAKKAVFTITVSGFYDEDNAANNRFEFGSTPGYAAPTTQEYDRGAALGTLPSADRGVDWQFLGWFSEPVGGDEITTNTVATEMTCYAHWREIRTVRFDANSYDEWSGQTDDIVVDPGEEVEIPECGFVREGRTFTGWSTSPNGMVEYRPGDTVTLDDDLQLYAIWDGPPKFIVDEYGYLTYVELNGATEVHIPDTVKYISGGMLDVLPDSLFDTNSIPCLRMLDGWIVNVTEEYWNTYGTGEEDAPYWNLDLTGVRGVVDDAFGGYARVSSLVVTQPILDYGVSAMFGCDDVSSVVIAEGATSVWLHSLSGLYNLTNVSIATSVSHIDQYAFDGCSEDLFDTSTVWQFRMVDGWIVGVSDDYWNYLDYSWNPDLTGARGIADFAFADAGDMLVSVTIPDTVQSISESAFAYCYALQSFEVAPGNTHYSSDDGLLLNAEGSRLLSVPYGRNSTVKIPDGVTEIAPFSFRGCSIESVSVPASVSRIDVNAFVESWIGFLVFEGNAPEVNGDCFENCGMDMVYAPAGSTGWNNTGDWKGLPFTYRQQPVFTVEGGTLVNVEVYGDLEIDIPDSVTRIAASAFGGGSCSRLVSVRIPDGVTSIEQGAFDGCPEYLFDTATIPGVRMVDGWIVGNNGHGWYGNLDLSGARGIAEFAFDGSCGFSSVTFGAEMAHVGEYAFNGCTELSAFFVAGGNARYSASEGVLLENGGRTLVRVPQGMQAVKIPDGVAEIAPFAFRGCNPQSVEIPSSVTLIDVNAFSECSAECLVFAGDAPEVNGEYFEDFSVGMTYVTRGTNGWDRWIRMGLSIEYKDAELFIEDGVLTYVEMNGTLEVEIPAGVTRIACGAFGSCGRLRGVKIPASVTHVEQGAFDGCPEYFFDTATIPGLRIADGWVVGLSDDYWNFYEPSWHVDLTGMKGIADHAFEGADMLVSVDMSKGVRNIGEYAFYGCYNLCSAEIGDNVERIGGWAFDDCSESLFDAAALGQTGVRAIGEWVVGYEDYGNGNSLVLRNVKGIAEHAFEGCCFSSVTIGDSVVRIGAHAFDGCDDAIYDRTSSPSVLIVDGWAVGFDGDYYGALNLKGIHGIADEAFSWNDSLSQVTMDDDVRIIGGGAFKYCHYLRRVAIGKGVKIIGCNAFSACDSALYDKTTVPGVCIVDGWAVGCADSLSGTVDLVGIRGIADYGFADCGAISGVSIPDGVRRICRGAFLDCANLSAASIPDSVTEIGEYAFDGCNASLYDLETLPGARIVDGWVVGDGNGIKPAGDIVLPEIRGIADFAFRDSVAMTSVAVPDSVVGIGDGAFSGCSSLTNMVLPFVGARRGGSETSDSLFGYIFGTVPYVGGVATLQEYRTPKYKGVCYSPNTYYECVFYIPGDLKHVTIMDETTIGHGAFSNCTGLESVSLNEGIQEIGDCAFMGCSGLARVGIPDTVEALGDSSFYGCDALRSMTLGPNVVYLGYSAFGDCTALKDFYFLGDAPYAEYDVFEGASKRMTIYVSPETTGWSSGSTDELPAYWPFGYIGDEGIVGRRIKVAQYVPEVEPGGGSSTSGATIGEVDVPGMANPSAVALTVTNVVVHYVTQSVPSSAVIPPTTAGIVNVISEVNAGAAVAVTAEWVEQYPGFEAKFGSDFAKAITAQTGKVDGAGKPMMVWQDFVAGTDPTDPEDVFQASITFDAETGEPVVSWTPELSPAEAAKRSYRKYGKVRLSDAEWTPIDGDATGYNFFKVTVEMR